MKFRAGDKAIVVGYMYHHFPNGKIVNLTKHGLETWTCCDENGDCQEIFQKHLTPVNTKQMNTQMKQAVLDTANKLLKAQNTVTTLEIKTQVIQDYPNFFWTQLFVSQTMDEFYNQNLFLYSDNGTYRTYASTAPVTNAPIQTVVPHALATTTKRSVQTKASTIGKKKAYELMTNNRGHFFTATFIDRKGEERTMNCQYLKGKQDDINLGYIKVKEAIKMKKGEKPIRQVNLQTLRSLKIGGQLYKIRK